MRCRPGYTLLELVIVLAIVSILSAVAIPRFGALRDQLDARGAANDAALVFEGARSAAIARATYVAVDIDSVAGVLTVHTGSDTLRRRQLAELHGVRTHATRTSMTYSPTGLGIGVSNLTLVLSKRAAADTVVVSRLGRVRW